MTVRCLYPLKVHARSPGHTFQMPGLSVWGSELVGFVNLLVVNGIEEGRAGTEMRTH